MKMEKPSPAITAAFEAVQPSGAEPRKMFGMPACFMNGNMFAGVYGRTIMLRLPEPERERLIKAGGAPFAPMGRVMREYVSVPPAFIADRAKLRPWIKKAQAFAASLPAKQPKARKTAAPAARAAAVKKRTIPAARKRAQRT